LHGYGDTGLQRFWGHEFDLLGLRDVIGHVTIRLGIMWLPIGGPLEPCVYLAPLRICHCTNYNKYMYRQKLTAVTRR